MNFSWSQLVMITINRFYALNLINALNLNAKRNLQIASLS